jgi:hypothetical protein
VQHNTTRLQNCTDPFSPPHLPSLQPIMMRPVFVLVTAVVSTSMGCQSMTQISGSQLKCTFPQLSQGECGSVSACVCALSAVCPT